MKEIILDYIKELDGKANFKMLQKKLDIDNEILEKLLYELKLDGKILQTSNRYILFPEDMLIAPISITKSGNKVIFYDGKVISLASNFFDYVFLNDTVSFVINNQGEAVITSIIDRKLNDVTCEVVGNGKKKKLVCFHKGIEVSLDNDVMDNLLEGDIILVNIGINDCDSSYCNCTFKKVLGNINDPNIDDIIIAANYGFDNDYSEAYLQELETIPNKVSELECVNRLDLRHLPFVTIDCVGAKDMDDAVYAEKTNTGYKVYVSISDVSHYIKLNSEIFKRALEKGNSYYASNSVFHMLHHQISNGICSLNEDEDRLTKTVIMNIDNLGNIVDYSIHKSVIRSRKKMDYDDIDNILIKNEVKDDYKEYLPLIKTLGEVTMLLEHKAVNLGGKLDFHSNETNPKYDEYGNMISNEEMEDTPARKLIEYLMINANNCVASYLYYLNIPSIYRNHATPDLRKVNDTIKQINESDIDVRLKMIDCASKPKVIQAILKELSSHEEFPILSNILLQSMQRAEYEVENNGHYALDLNTYTHFTSPIRRVADLLIHTILDVIIEDYELLNKIDYKEMEDFLREACKQASRMERQADVAEEESKRLEVIKNMVKDVGCEYEAVILDIGDKIRVRINGIDAFVKYKYLSDNFIYEPHKRLWYDKNNDGILKMGAKILVRIDSINIFNRMVNLDVLGIVNPKKLIKKRVK